MTTLAVLTLLSFIAFGFLVWVWVGKSLRPVKPLPIRREHEWEQREREAKLLTDE